MNEQTCAFEGGEIPICCRNDKNIWSSMAVSFSSDNGTIGTDTSDARQEVRMKSANLF